MRNDKISIYRNRTGTENFVNFNCSIYVLVSIFAVVRGHVGDGAAVVEVELVDRQQVHVMEHVTAVIGDVRGEHETRVQQQGSVKLRRHSLENN